MPTEKLLQTIHKKAHDELSNDYYSGESGLTKEKFDQLHGQLHEDFRAALIAEGYLVEPPASSVFEPPHSETSTSGVAERIAYLESYLKQKRMGVS